MTVPCRAQDGFTTTRAVAMGSTGGFRRPVIYPGYCAGDHFRRKYRMPFSDRIPAAAKSAAAAAIALVASIVHATTPSEPENPTDSVELLGTDKLEQRGITSLDGIAAALPGISSTPA